MELAFSLKSVHHFIDQTSDNEDNEIEESEKTPSPPSIPLSATIKGKEKRKEKEDRNITSFLGYRLLQEYHSLQIDGLWNFVCWEKFYKSKITPATPNRFQAIFADTNIRKSVMGF